MEETTCISFEKGMCKISHNPCFQLLSLDNLEENLPKETLNWVSSGVKDLNPIGFYETLNKPNEKVWFANNLSLIDNP
jgi:hypothetical protein